MGGSMTSLLTNRIEAPAPEVVLPWCYSITEPSGGDRWKLWDRPEDLLPSGSLRSCRILTASHGFILAIVDAPGVESAVRDHMSAVRAYQTAERIVRAASTARARVEHHDDHELHAASEQVRRVREVLSLTVSELAEVIGVSRQTVHAWQRSTARPTDENLERLQSLAALAEHWEGLGDVPLGRWLKVRDYDTDQTVLELLLADAEIEKVLAALERTAARMEQRRELVRQAYPGDVGDRATQRQLARLQLQRNRALGR
jgi:DNA-binding transcriptional regulator YiaG